MQLRLHLTYSTNWKLVEYVELELELELELLQFLTTHINLQLNKETHKFASKGYFIVWNLPGF